ncbi:putative house-cleaning noncanonical NTP pyrophosphatase (MazG superfamily) [Paenibacillus eucommiae]|uniref:House-cleaning noncanonical NTP pyrophosphatase (MazG superfamily) n=1 Tax=Paenibacillus eucommiae TaxID=1355755 RepID=A0ABS4J3B0_9BACL|nr:putative house-cleaning noncanonical NTP pyrophosphatase (MazG superfamily) [Paenibacillus eucommiae]
MLEVIRALAGVHGASWEQLEAIRVQKAEAAASKIGCI